MRNAFKIIRNFKSKGIGAWCDSIVKSSSVNAFTENMAVLIVTWRKTYKIMNHLSYFNLWTHSALYCCNPFLSSWIILCFKCRRHVIITRNIPLQGLHCTAWGIPLQCPGSHRVWELAKTSPTGQWGAGWREAWPKEEKQVHLRQKKGRTSEALPSS